MLFIQTREFIEEILPKTNFSAPYKQKVRTKICNTSDEIFSWEKACELAIKLKSSNKIQIEILKLLVKYYAKGYIIKDKPKNLLCILNKAKDVKAFNKMQREDLKRVFKNKDYINFEKVLVIYVNPKSQPTTFFENYCGNNKYLYEIISSFCISGYISVNILNSRSYPGIKHLVTNFEQGLRREINKITDFNDSVILQKIHSITEMNESIEIKTSAIKTLFRLVEYLENEFNLNNTFILFHQKVLRFFRLPGYIAKGFIYCSYPVEEKIINTNNKFVVFSHNLDNISNKHEKISLTKLDFSNLLLYQEELKKYILRNSPLKLSDGTLSGTIIALNILKTVKENFGTVNDKRITREECILFVNSVKDKDFSLASKNDLIGYLRRFIEYVDTNGLIIVEKECRNHLKQIGEAASSKKHSLKKEDLNKLENYLLNKTAVSHISVLVYCAFELMLKTEMRPTQILALRKSNISIDNETNTVTIKSISKTSKGKKITYSYGLKIKKIIQLCLEHSEIHNDYLFGIKKIYTNKEHLILGSFNREISKACEQLNIPLISALKLRNTYMTTVMKYAIKKNLSTLQIKNLTGHRRIKTTLNNYVDEDDFLISYLEQTYQIEIGQEQIEEIRPELHFKRTIEDNSELFNTKNTVGNECGLCSLDEKISCSSSCGGFSCLVCKNFVTTLRHKKYFINTIECLALQIKESNDIHEKEELNAVKNICGIYLHEILKRENNNDFH